MQVQHALGRIEYLFLAHGHNRYGEAMTQSQHAVQAGRLALSAGQDEDVVLGAFLHDIGHLMVHDAPETQRDDAIYRHQCVGADFLGQLGFCARIADLVEHHVDAKRYLTAVDPAYRATLSAASIESLGFQGGPMSEAEVTAFESLPDKDLYIQLRHWDDQAKNPDDADVDMTRFFTMIERHLKGCAGE